MDIKELEKNLAVESAKLVELRAQYDKVRSAYLNELERDCERSEGSMRQEALREKHQEELRNTQYSAEKALDEQKKSVRNIAASLLS